MIKTNALPLGRTTTIIYRNSQDPPKCREKLWKN